MTEGKAIIMFEPDELFTREDKNKIYSFLNDWPQYQEIVNYRKISPQKVKTLFYGDSITANFPLKEFFPNASLLNRGIGGDNVNGLFFRMEDDVFPYQPEQVVMLIGINGIEMDFTLIIRKIAALAVLMKERGIRVWLCSILPLRNPDRWNRFQYQEKIVQLNRKLQEIGEKEFAGFIDYHSAMKDENGELAPAFSMPDGTHVTFAGYQEMVKVLTSRVLL